MNIAHHAKGNYSHRRLSKLGLRAQSPALGEKRSERVVLLQGPVGPFFKHLQSHLQNNDYDVWRICFHPGDRFFSQKQKCINFSGDIADWENWFSDFVVTAQIDQIILFGSRRVIHQVARKIAVEANIAVVALEEGYIRPGYISIEQGGNNANSPLAGRLPPAEFTPPSTEEKAKDFNGLHSMCIYAALYYAVRTFFSSRKQKQLFHRKLAPLSEISYWPRNVQRRIFRQSRNLSIIQSLLEHYDRRFYLVPLQVTTDSQMQDAALGWNLVKLISATLKSFARHAPTNTRLVFKVHPLERGHSNHEALIRGTAKAYGIHDRVDVIDSGSLGLLTRHAAGMITINSTSGLSAICHGTPLLVIGEAIYAHPSLATCAQGNPDFDSFWTSKHMADNVLRRNYLAWLKSEALMPGDFYDAEGMEVACESIATKLQAKNAERVELTTGRPAP